MIFYGIRLAENKIQPTIPVVRLKKYTDTGRYEAWLPAGKFIENGVNSFMFFLTRRFSFSLRNYLQ